MGKDKAPPPPPLVITPLNGRPPRGHKQRGAGTVIVAKPAVITTDGIVLKAHERMPSQLLHEYCQKEKRPNPKYYHLPPGNRFKVILEDSKNIKNNLEFIPNQTTFESQDISKNYGALLALYHLQKTLPLERKMPEPYSTTWMQMVAKEKEEKSSASGGNSRSNKQTPAIPPVTLKPPAPPLAPPSVSAVEDNTQTQYTTTYSKKKTSSNVVVAVAIDENADWLCNNCGKQNFSKLATGQPRVKCFSCSEKKTDLCTIVSSTSSSSSIASTSTYASAGSISSSSIGASINLIDFEKRPKAVLDLHTTNAYTSAAEKDRARSEDKNIAKRKRNYWDAVKRANRPIPILMSPKIKSLLEKLLYKSSDGQYDNTSTTGNHVSKVLHSLTSVIKEIYDVGSLIEPTVSMPAETQLKSMCNAVSILKKQGFSDSAIASSLVHARDSTTELFLDEVEGGNKNFQEVLLEICMEYICLHVDELLLPESFNSLSNQSEKQLDVFNPAKSGGFSSNSRYSNSNYGWSDAEIAAASSIIALLSTTDTHDDNDDATRTKSNNELNRIKALLLLWHASFISQSMPSLLHPNLVEYLLTKPSDAGASHHVTDNTESSYDDSLIVEEIEALTSIYTDKVIATVIHDTRSRHAIQHLSFILKIPTDDCSHTSKRSTSHGSSSSSECVVDVFVHPLSNYPSNMPLVLIQHERATANETLALMQVAIWNAAKGFLGDMMVFNIVSYIQDNLVHLMKSYSNSSRKTGNLLGTLSKIDNLSGPLGGNGDVTAGGNSSNSTSEDDVDGASTTVESSTASSKESSSRCSSGSGSKKIHKGGNQAFWTRPITVLPSPPPISPALSKSLSCRKLLPAWDARSEFIDKLALGRAMVVTGETGCGKTTQIPQYILEAHPSAKIVVCQPRRLAAVGVAMRVAEELDTVIGDRVGYMVKGESKVSNHTQLVFCTYGVLLRRLHDDRYLDSIDYVVLDEVHERGMDSDFALALLMSILSDRRSSNTLLKVIVMSATISTDKFTAYLGQYLSPKYSSDSSNSNSTHGRLGAVAPLLHIPGKTYPVVEYYKKDFEDTVRSISECAASSHSVRSMDAYDDDYSSSNTSTYYNKNSVIDYELLVKLIICLSSSDVTCSVGDTTTARDESNSSRSKDMLAMATGSILVFMPGVPEINRLISLLEDSWDKYSRSWKPLLMALHGNLSSADQRKIFDVTSTNRLKVIVSTNVAEASVTIPDCTVVIDTCRVKEMDFDTSRQMTSLVMKFASQDSLRQRRGRAGRVQEGRCFRLITMNTYTGLPATSIPEILRLPIDSLVLQVKAMASMDHNECMQLLENTPDVPSLSSINMSIANLTQLQALNANSSHEITPLGTHLASLPIAAPIGKMLIYGSLFGCVYMASAIAASLSNKSPFLNMNDEDSRKTIKDIQLSFSLDTNSDHISKALMLQSFSKCIGITQKRSFCKQHLLLYDRMTEIQQTQYDLLDSLAALGGGRGFLSSRASGIDLASYENRNNNKLRIISCVTIAGLYGSICKVMKPAKRFIETLGGNIERDADAKEIKYYIKDRFSAVDSSSSSSSSSGSSSNGNGYKDDNMSTDGLQRVFLHSSSICYAMTSFKSSNYILYSESQLFTPTTSSSSSRSSSGSSTDNKKIFLRDISANLSPYALLLFGNRIECDYLEGTVLIDGWIKFAAPGKLVSLLQYLRRSLDMVLKEKLSNENSDDDNAAANDTDVIDITCKLLANDGM